MPRGVYERKKKDSTPEVAQAIQPSEILVGAKLEDIMTLSSYENKNITFQGEVKGYDYETLLKDKQKNIYKFYELSDYFCDEDSLYGGIIKRVLSPFSVSSGFKLKGVSEKVKQRYLDHYKAIGFYDVMRSIFFELYKYSNVFIYFHPENGSIVTLPQHRCRIADISIKGEALVELNIRDLLKSSRSTLPKQQFIDEIKERAKAYPVEVQKAVSSSGSGEWIQLDPENTFVLQETKESWQRYSVPMVAACLKAFSKKALISNYENSQLSIGARSFLHVKIGEKEKMTKIDQKMITDTAAIFKSALNTFPLAVTSWFVSSEFVGVEKQQNLFDKSKYNEVNSAILSAGGISSIVVSGQNEGGSSFAQAQISITTAAERIKQNQDNFEEMMYKFNLKLADILKATGNKIPQFSFERIDLNNDGTIKEEALKLYSQGIISKRTLSEAYDYDMDQEVERRTEEAKEIDEILIPPINPNTSGGDPNANPEGGNPGKPISKSKTDKNNSKTSAQPKPSSE